MQVYLKDLEYRIYNAKPFKHIPTTEPEPFKFRQTLVRKILLPEKVSSLIGLIALIRVIELMLVDQFSITIILN